MLPRASTIRIVSSLILAIALLLIAVSALAASPSGEAGLVESVPQVGNPNPPASPVRLVFIHHSSGANWLNDALRAQLNANKYYVTETDYGWGPDDLDLGSANIGDHTDIGHWYNWFAGPHRDTYMAALYSNNNYEASNVGVTDPGGENRVIMFKSCFPNSNLGGSPTDPPTTGNNPLRGQSAGSQYMTVGNAKGIYNDILAYFATRQDKLFIVITAPPLSQASTSAQAAANARALNNWLVNNWLKNYPYHNVAVFDFYNTLTSNGGSPSVNDLNKETGNHHRYWNFDIQHIVGLNNNYSKYANPGDDHPTSAGNKKAAAEYLPLLNVYYHKWQGDPDPLLYKAYLPLIMK